MPERVWRKGNPLLGRNVNGTTTMENSMEVPQKTNNRTIIWSSNPTKEPSLTPHFPHCLLPTSSHQVLVAQPLRSILSSISSFPFPLLRSSPSHCLLSPRPKQGLSASIPAIILLPDIHPLFHSWPKSFRSIPLCSEQNLHVSAWNTLWELILPSLLSLTFSMFSLTVFLRHAKIFPTTQSLDRLSFCWIFFARHRETPPFL